ncbi:hypothetical protein [Sporomusa silvacetica]|uniref:hypothetical protein n=1 Tax=Sporomusa silvacetica TaxID=55504 RepID=UPI000B99ED5D|nr:hypothetical protein [Sporomusa silvacetica]
MLSVVDSKYGNELGSFELDYLGDLPGFDIVILNATVKLFDKGLFISSLLSSDNVFITSIYLIC